MNNEHAPKSPEQSAESLKEIEDAGLERKAELEKSLEQSIENKPETDIESAKHEALEAAQRAEKEHKAEVSPAEKPKIRKRPDKAMKKASFNKTMKETQAHMPTPSRAFSKVIHSRGVERTSEVVGSTVARPNAILAGSLTAFLVTLGIYLFARYYGYPLSGFETIGSFILGWMLGILFDYLRVMITGKKA
jgi:hypothetical protein